jgi:hypothetical protein
MATGVYHEDNAMEQAADLYNRHREEGGKNGNYIETIKGTKFYFEAPEFDAEVIAYATSMQCRFTGHTMQFYSVAQHMCLVAYIMQQVGLGNPFEGLLHDAQEAYLSDVNAPAKSYIPDYRALEARIEAPLRQWAGLPGDVVTEGCKRADWLALFIEAHYLLPTKGTDWLAPPGVKEQAAELIATGLYEIVGWAPAHACKAWLAAYKRFQKPAANAAA